MDELFRPLYAPGAHLRHFKGGSRRRATLSEKQRLLNQHRHCTEEIPPVVPTTRQPQPCARCGQPQPDSASRRR